MSKAMRAITAGVAGFVVGSLVNGAIVAVGPSLVPPPTGADMTTVEGLTAAMSRLEPKHFAMPFLAHALGTFVGATVAVIIATAYRTRLAYIIGFVFLAGGIVAAKMIPAPNWFIALDLLVAYHPMAWLGLAVGRRLRPDTPGLRP
ncbi:hypothetical protein [Gemmatimonas sp.]|uniref:hypothetical protein n=1 Tax=Gemmatimonas sp. TaxID=1962908 RepID=UPI0037BFA4F2